MRSKYLAHKSASPDEYFNLILNPLHLPEQFNLKYFLSYNGADGITISNNEKILC